MLNFSNNNSIETLNHISIQFNRYFSIFIFLFGTIGNLLNCLVLSRSCLRSNSCAFLFLISSIANLISIIFGLTTRILSGWNMDLTNTNSFICKFRSFIMFVSRTIAFWLIAFASIDRWFSSSFQYKRRRLSSLKIVQQETIILIIFSIILYSQIFYCYDSNLISIPLYCYAKTIKCRLLTDLTYTFITILCPLLIMCIFSLLTILNIHKIYLKTCSKSKLLNTKKTLEFNNYQKQRWKRIDRYLRHVLFIQIIFLIILTIPQVFEKLYITLTIYNEKTLLHITIDKFIYNIVLLLTYLASGIPFYVYTLCGGKLFRKTFLNSLSSIYEYIAYRIFI